MHPEEVTAAGGSGPSGNTAASESDGSPSNMTSGPPPASGLPPTRGAARCDTMKNPHERGGVAAEAQLHGPGSFAPGPNRFAVLAADGDDGSAKAQGKALSAKADPYE